MRAFGRIIKGIYDILATYLLVKILYIAAVSVGLHFLVEQFIAARGVEDTALYWNQWAQTSGFSVSTIKLAVFGVLHVGVFLLLKGVLSKALRLGESLVTQWGKVRDWFITRAPKLMHNLGVLFTISVTLVLVPFILQPTLVGLDMRPIAWKIRLVNLIDGDATLEIQNSVVNLYRKPWAQEQVVPPEQRLDDDVIDRSIGRDGDIKTVAPSENAASPMMDRWDPIIWKAAKGDPNRFAQIKAFMYVESGGRQFALSHTGCAGLMQFCSGTAKSGVFKNIFGVGQVMSCGCHRTSCRVPKTLQRSMERGDKAAIKQAQASFPCDLTDARFNPYKAIHAGAAYVEKLHNSVGGNMYLMYVGYNSGPGIARKVYAALGKKPNASLDEIQEHLADAMRPHYGTSSDARARSLLRTHLPKIKRVYTKYQGTHPKP